MDLNTFDVAKRYTAETIMIGLFIMTYIKIHKDASNNDILKEMSYLRNETLELRKDFNKIVLLIAGKLATKEQMLPLINATIALEFREMQLDFYSKVDKNNVAAQIQNIKDEIDILTDNKLNNIEYIIKQSGNSEISDEIKEELKPIFAEYASFIKKLFQWYGLNHKTWETKRSISNLTTKYLEKCKDTVNKKSL